MSDGTTTKPETPPPPMQQINYPAGSMGILGPAGQVMQLTAMVVLCCILIWFIYTDRADRLSESDRNRADQIARELMFRDSVRDLQTQADRHTGEIKGAVDKNTEVMRDLIGEIKQIPKMKPVGAGLSPIPPS